MNKTIKKLQSWSKPVRHWFYFNGGDVMVIGVALLFTVMIIFGIAYSCGAFFDEVENYDFTAQVYDKEHYTTQSVSYVSSGKTSVPVYHTHHHYKVMWEDGDIRDSFEIGESHFDKIKIGDFINVHCSVKADKKGELHYYYTFKGY